MASNPISKALQDLARRVLPLIKGFLQQEAPVQLEVFYQEYLNTQDKPRTSRTGRKYYDRPNTTPKLRTQYGNLLRATKFGQPGNFYDLAIEGSEVVIVSGIDFDTPIRAGGSPTTLKYGQYWEEGMKRRKNAVNSTYRKRPFLNPGFAKFNEEGLPAILDRFADELAETYGS